MDPPSCFIRFRSYLAAVTACANAGEWQEAADLVRQLHERSKRLVKQQERQQQPRGAASNSGTGASTSTAGTAAPLSKDSPDSSGQSGSGGSDGSSASPDSVSGGDGQRGSHTRQAPAAPQPAGQRQPSSNIVFASSDCCRAAADAARAAGEDGVAQEMLTIMREARTLAGAPKSGQQHGTVPHDRGTTARQQRRPSGQSSTGGSGIHQALASTLVKSTGKPQQARQQQPRRHAQRP